MLVLCAGPLTLKEVNASKAQVKKVRSHIDLKITDRHSFYAGERIDTYDCVMLARLAHEKTTLRQDPQLEFLNYYMRSPVSMALSTVGEFYLPPLILQKT